MYIKKLLSTPLLLSFLLTPMLQAENSIGIDINNDDVELLTSININALTGYADGTTYLLDINYLHTDGDNMASIGFLGQNKLQGVESLALSFGIKGVVTDNFLALPLTVKGSYILPLVDSIPTTSLSVGFSYAPSILSFRDAENYSDFRVEANMEIISNVHLFTGYRNISTDYESKDHTFNNSFYGGMRLSF